MIDLSIDKEVLERTFRRAREKNIIIPTFKQQRNPDLMLDSIKERFLRKSYTPN